MAANNTFEIGNVTNTSKYKPKESMYNDSWIEFWRIEVGAYKPKNCCVVDCQHEKPISEDTIVGGHVYVSAELSKVIDDDLELFCTYPSRRVANGFLCNNGYWYKPYGNLIVMMRCGDKLVKTKGGKVICIAPICNSCNKRTDSFFLKDKTVLVPLFWNDQKEVEE